MHARKSPPLRFGDRRLHLGLHLVARRTRNDALHEVLGIVDEDTGRRPVRCTLNVTAVGILRLRRDSRGLDRGSVREAGVSVDPRDVHRIVRHGCAQLLLRREARVAPVVLIPSASDDPLAGLHGFHSCDDARDHLVVRARAGEIDSAKREPEVVDVTVRVDHAGDDRASAEVHDAGGCTAERHDRTRGADELHLPAAHGHGVGERMCLVNGIDARVRDDEVSGRLLRLLLRGSEGREEQEEESAWHSGTGWSLVARGCGF